MKAVFPFIIFCWVLLAFFGILYNSQKTLSEIKEWYYLSDFQKRNKMFGNIYDFFVFINDHTEKDAQVILFAQDVRIRYLSLYYLYPRIVIGVQDKKEFEKLIKEKKFTYVAYYNGQTNQKNYIKIASFSAEKSTDYGLLYQLK